ncbi:MAG TPA: S9 family peptidase [Rhodanobacteraceae bacterium]|nr:S9 family peptidase [Rhodanobacteraceae bacterium]
MRWFTIALALFAVSSFGAVPAPERPITDPASIQSAGNPAAHPVPIPDLFYTRDNIASSWSPDGRTVVISTNLTGRYNLWLENTQGSWPIQLTNSADRQDRPTWSPDGQWIVYESVHGGNGIWQLNAVPAQGGPSVSLTSNPDVRHTSVMFSPDGSSLAFDRRVKDAPADDIAVMDWKTHAIRQLTHEATANHFWHLVAWSADSHFLYANRFNDGFSDGSAWRIDVATGNAEELTPHKGNVFIAANDVSPDGRWLSGTSNALGGHDHAMIYDIARHKYRWITTGPWQAGAGAFTPDGKRVTYFINGDGRVDLYMYDLADGRSEKLAMPPGFNGYSGWPSPYSPDGTRMLVAHQSSSEPSDYWICPVDGGAPRQLTFSALASLKPSALPASQLVHYKSFDGTVISAFVWMPANLKRDGSAPAVVMAHGGPAGQWLDEFDPVALALASRGYAVIAPNVRGSTGYGKAFELANVKDLGGGDLKDEVYAAKFLVATGYVNPKKIGITGESYGGYMALMAIGKTPDVWAAAVDESGVFNWLTMAEHQHRPLEKMNDPRLGNPIRDRKIYEADSPVTYVGNMKAPLLILQGDNDPIVPKEEATQAMHTIKASGRIVEAHFYPDEGHSLDKREDQIDALQRTVAWFNRYLKNEPAAATSH